MSRTSSQTVALTDSSSEAVSIFTSCKKLQYFLRSAPRSDQRQANSRAMIPPGRAW